MNKNDICDIIVENLTQEWMMSNMSNQKFNEKWEVSQYSKSEINSAGKIIADPITNKEERHVALEILNNWRASHAYPLHIIASNLRFRNPNAIVAQRLKRLDSITSKIERFPTMNLYRMQDLGGCRVIIDGKTDQVYDSLNRYKKSRIRHILKRENDYIQNPKPSGYRSYHMVYQFHSDKKETYNKNMLIEIQFRTQIQHVWATAVEMMGIYTKSQLKAGIGDKDVLRFFALISSVFAIVEKSPEIPGTSSNIHILISEIKEIDNRCNITSRLSALSVAINHVNKDKKFKNNGYYVLQLNYKAKKLNVYPFPKIELATNVYDKIEGLNNPDLDVVLVSATSFDALRVAYPNYFTDTSGFVSIIGLLLD